MGQTVSIGIGKANITPSLATYAAFKVTPPFSRITAVNSGVRKGMGSTVQVGAYDFNGQLYTHNVEHDNGTVILLQAKWMSGPHLVREGALFMRLRFGAPMYEVIASVPTGNDNMCGDSFRVFTGYADILNASELRMLGLEVGKGYISRYMEPAELEECYRIIQIGRESAPRPAVEEIETPTGVELREVAQMPARRMILRNRG